MKLWCRVGLAAGGNDISGHRSGVTDLTYPMSGFVSTLASFILLSNYCPALRHYVRLPFLRGWLPPFLGQVTTMGRFARKVSITNNGRS